MTQEFSNLGLELERLNLHNHLCLLYEKPEEWRDAAVYFLSIGLRRNEKCLCIIDTSSADHIRSYLQQEGIDVPAVEKSGQLINLQATDIYLRDSSFVPGRMIAFIIAQVEKAFAEGYQALRIFSDMSWVMNGDTDLNKLPEYEAKLNRNLFPSYPCSSLCIYDRRKLSPEVIKGAIMTHPILMQGNRIYRNPYYLSPDEFLSREPVKHEIDLLLKTVHELSALETQRRQSDELSQALFDYSMIGLYITQDGKFQLFSPEFEKAMGYNRNDLLGVEALSFVLSEDRYTVEQNRMKMLEGECSSPYEYRIVTKNGEVRWFLETVTSVRYGGKRSILGNTIDITERKLAEATLRESEEKLRLIFESVPEGISICDLEGRILDINQGAIYMQGCNSKEELIGRNGIELIAKSDHVVTIKEISEMLEKGSSGITHCTSMRKDGSEYPAAWSAAVLRDYASQPIGFVVIAIDTTEQQKMQQQLMIADRLASMGQLVAGIAHEINNPLTGVVGFSELVLKNHLADDVREDLEIVNKEAKRAAGVIRELLTFVRNQKTDKVPEDISILVQEVLQLRSYHQSVNNIEVETQFMSDLPQVIVNAPQMKQVFMNLVINAEQAMIEANGRGKLKVATENSGPMVRISFSDDGLGISDVNMKKLFSPFFTTKDVGQGTGLGLVVCQGIVTEHGGRIYARSKLGKGASFFVELPIPVGGESNE